MGAADSKMLLEFKVLASFDIWVFKPLRIFPKIRTLKSNVVELMVQMEAYRHSPVQVDACSSAMLDASHKIEFGIMSYKHVFSSTVLARRKRGDPPQIY